MTARQQIYWSNSSGLYSQSEPELHGCQRYTPKYVKHKTPPVRLPEHEAERFTSTDLLVENLEGYQSSEERTLDQFTEQKKNGTISKKTAVAPQPPTLAMEYEEYYHDKAGQPRTPLRGLGVALLGFAALMVVLDAARLAQVWDAGITNDTGLFYALHVLLLGGLCLCASLHPTAPLMSTLHCFTVTFLSAHLLAPTQLPLLTKLLSALDAVSTVATSDHRGMLLLMSAEQALLFAYVLFGVGAVGMAVAVLVVAARA